MPTRPWRQRRLAMVCGPTTEKTVKSSSVSERFVPVWMGKLRGNSCQSATGERRLPLDYRELGGLCFFYSTIPAKPFDQANRLVQGTHAEFEAFQAAHPLNKPLHLRLVQEFRKYHAFTHQTPQRIRS